MTFSRNQIIFMEKIVNANQNKLPSNFHWQSYILRNQDLAQAGFDTELSAKYHFLVYGTKENREWHKIENPIQTKSQLRNHDSINSKKICISVLLYYPEDKSIHFLEHFPEVIAQECGRIGITDLTIVLRNNSGAYNNKQIQDIITKLRKKINYINFDIIYHTSYNMGYGLGHNTNLLDNDSEIFIIMNDDVGFPHVKWLSQAIHEIENNNVGIVGAYQSPHILSDFVDGHTRNYRHLTEAEYAEGSLLIMSGSLFKRVGGFDKRIRYFYFEDVDLCLRLKQLGYSVSLLDMPHQHYRNTSTNRINGSFKSSIIELNRAYFLSKWKNYMNHRNITSKILIDLSSDGIGDVVDCFYPVRTLIDGISKEISIDMVVPQKIKCLFDYFQCNYIDKSDFNYNELNYDTIYTIKDINFSVPMHTTDIIAAKFGLNSFDTDENSVKKFIHKNISRDIQYEHIDHKLQYIVMHLDSQRQTFEGRTPNASVIIDIINELAPSHNIVIIGQSKGSDPDINKTIKKNKLIDHRDSNIDHMLSIINGAKLFIGLDSGPSHIAQLLNIPSYIIYGPINPATKIFRYHNSGCFYNTNGAVVDGAYHVNLEPAYHFDIRRDNATMPKDSPKLIASINHFIESKYKFDWLPIFESLRQNQRDFLMVQLHNPVFHNKILTKQNISLKSRIDSITEIVASYENLALKSVGQGS